jgi:hypothetical protein
MFAFPSDNLNESNHTSFVIPSSRLACGKLREEEHGKAVFAIQAQRAGTKNQPSPEGLGP